MKFLVLLSASLMLTLTGNVMADDCGVSQNWHVVNNTTTAYHGAKTTTTCTDNKNNKQICVRTSSNTMVADNTYGAGWLGIMPITQFGPYRGSAPFPCGSNKISKNNCASCYANHFSPQTNACKKASNWTTYSTYYYQCNQTLVCMVDFTVWGNTAGSRGIVTKNFFDKNHQTSTNPASLPCGYGTTSPSQCASCFIAHGLPSGN